MSHRMHRVAFAAFVLTCCFAAPAASQAAGRDGRSIVIAAPQYATLPIPTLMEGPAANSANFDVADQLFLRLAELGPGLNTAGDRGFMPVLARSWHRRDSLTLVFDLDPRARWHDGVPVTARDVVFTFERALDPKICPRLARPLRYIASVTAEGMRRVVVRFSRVYAEQFYDAVYHVQPLPAHLLADMPAEALRSSAFTRHPVGNGPFRWSRGVPGQFIELVANRDFFLGAPALDRVIFRVAESAEARLNLVLSGGADALHGVIPPLSNIERIEARDGLRIVTVPSASVGYLLFNYRDPADLSRPHPILSDRAVRRAIVLGLDREAMTRSVFGPYARVPVGPVSPMLWIAGLGLEPAPYDPAAARRYLEQSGWRDHDGDGIREKQGRPLSLTLQLPTTSAIRKRMALQAQAQLRQIGIDLQVRALDGPVWIERRNQGKFDIDFSAAIQDPTPSGLVQSWSCAGMAGTNVGGYCNPAVDSLMELAILSKTDPSALWREALRRIEADAPAVFLYAPTLVFAVSRRFDDVHLRPESPWLRLREWSLAGDRVAEREAAGR